MKTKTLVTLSVVLLGTAFAANAGNWSFHIGVGAPVYYPPAHVVVLPAPCPPPQPVMHCPPPRVVCAPPVRFVPPGHAKRYYYDRPCRSDYREPRYGYGHPGHW